MQLETRNSNDVLIVTPLEKRIDARVAAAFRLALLDRVDAGARRIVVNLCHVEFMDSSGLGALVSALKRIGRGGELTVCSPGAGVRSMLELTRLNRIIPVVEHEADVVTSAAPA
jgi:anti-sigma B factor antagonist